MRQLLPSICGHSWHPYKCLWQVFVFGLYHNAPPVTFVRMCFFVKWRKLLSYCTHMSWRTCVIIKQIQSNQPDSVLSSKLFDGLSGTPSGVKAHIGSWQPNQMGFIPYYTKYAIQLPVKAAAKCTLTFLNPEYLVHVHLCVRSWNECYW